MERPVSKSEVPIHVTDERWTHVVEPHDYMTGNLELVVETIEDPDYIMTGRKGELIVEYEQNGEENCFPREARANHRTHR